MGKIREERTETMRQIKIIASKEAAASKEEIEEGKGTDDNLNEAIKSKDTEICHIYIRIIRFLQAFQ